MTARAVKGHVTRSTLASTRGDWFWDTACYCHANGRVRDFGWGWAPTQHEAMTAAAQHIRTHHREDQS